MRMHKFGEGVVTFMTPEEIELLKAIMRLDVSVPAYLRDSHSIPSGRTREISNMMTRWNETYRLYEKEVASDKD